MIYLNDFEKHIERALVNRGFDLFQDGAVTSLERQGQNVCASVEESACYQVKLKKENGFITNAVCTCSYDQDNWCRHQVAVMFQLLDRDKEKSITELLKSASKEQLVDLLQSLTSSHENLESHIRFFLSDSSEDHKIWARRLVSEALEDADYGGFIPWHKTFEATLGASYVLEQAEEAWRDKDIIKTVDLTFVVIEELVDYVDETDDSSGLFGSEIDQAIRLLNKAMRQAIIYLDREDYLAIIDQVIEATQHERFREWPEWSVEILRGVIIYGVMSEVREKIEAALQHIASFRQGLNRHMIVFEYDMKWELGDTDLNSFLNRYLDIPDIRERAIEKAESEGDSDWVIDLIETAQVIKESWYDILYRHYEKLGFTEQQRQLAKNLLCEFGMTYYDYLRKLYPDDEWTLVVKSLIDDEAHRFRGEHYAQFLLKEQQYHYLLAYCQDYPNSIRNFAPYLKDVYLKEVLTLFEILINQEADMASDRKAYQRVCETIINMQKICGYNETLPIIEELEREYYRRPAFLDELSRVKI